MEESRSQVVKKHLILVSRCHVAGQCRFGEQLKVVVATHIILLQSRLLLRSFGESGDLPIPVVE
jgi:hypothetical protein